MVADMQQKRFRPGAYSDWLEIPSQTIKNDPYYQEFRRTHDLGYMTCVVTHPNPGEIFAIGLQLHSQQDPLDRQGLKDFNRIARHLNRALAICCRIEELWDRNRTLESVASSQKHSLAVISRSGRLQFANASFADLKDIISISTYKIEFRSSDNQRMFELLLTTAFNRNKSSTRDYFLCKRPNGRFPIKFRVMPLSRSNQSELAGLTSSEDRALLVGYTTERISDPDVESILAALGLTRREAAVAALVSSGLSPKAAGDILGISVETVRSNLKRIYMKLGIGRQSELARMVQTLVQN